MLSTILIFTLILLIVVIGHEFGHFIVAKWCGVKVEEFGIGLPPKVWGIRPKDSETEYTLNLLPLGGFVRLYGEDGDNHNDPRSFAYQVWWKRIAILSAGVMMNIIIAVISFTVVGVLGSPVQINEDDIDQGQYSNIGTTITFVNPDSPAEIGGLRFGDMILSINGVSVTTPSDVQTIIESNKGNTVEFEIERGKAIETKSVLVRKDPVENQGATGILLELTGVQKLSIVESFKLAFVRIYILVTTTFEFLTKIILSPFTGASIPSEASVTGPVGLVSIIGDFRDLGIVYLVTFIGLISTSLALFNILPIPALDGGRIVFVLIEKIKGSPISLTLEQRIHTGGYIILIGLMLLVTVQDIIKLF